MNIDTVGKQKNSVRLRLIRLEFNRNLTYSCLCKMFYLSRKPGQKLSVKERIAALTMLSFIHLNCEEKNSYL